MAGFHSSQRHLNQNQRPGRAIGVQGTGFDYNNAEPMVTESSEAPKTELGKTQELLKILDSVQPLIDKSREEVRLATDKLVTQAKATTMWQLQPDDLNDTITKQKKEIDELRKKLAEVEQENKSIEDKYNKAYDKLDKSKNFVAMLQRRNEELTTKNDGHKSRLNNILRSNELMKEHLQQANEEKSKLEDELNTMKMRLSKVLGNKISDNNPDIADLSDMNRPTKIGERYSELYDNEWTDAFEEFNDHYDDKKCVRMLLTVLRKAKTHCDDMAEKQKKLITEALCLTKDMHDISQVDVKKQIKDMRKEAASQSVQQVQKSFEDVLLNQLSTSASAIKAIFKTKKVQNYTKKCVEICWLMSVQDPPLTFGVDVTENSEFDTNKYKHYTRTGDRIEYLVWPELYLKEGAVLSKGVAQGAGRMQSARERRRKDDTADEGKTRPQSAPATRAVTTHQSSQHHQQGYDCCNYRQAARDETDQMSAKSTSTY